MKIKIKNTKKPTSLLIKKKFINLNSFILDFITDFWIKDLTKIVNPKTQKRKEKKRNSSLKKTSLKKEVYLYRRVLGLSPLGSKKKWGGVIKNSIYIN